MKTSLLKSALVAVVGLALCAPVALRAASTPTDTDAAMAATSSKLKKTEYHGVVKSIDAAGGTIVVTTKGGDLTLTIDDKTKVEVSKKKAALSDITEGEKVTGSYTKDAGGKMIACKVDGHPAKAAAAAPATPAAPAAQ